MKATPLFEAKVTREREVLELLGDMRARAMFADREPPLATREASLVLAPGSASWDECWTDEPA